MTTAYHLQANGKAERTNQELKQYLRKYANHQQDNWPELVPLAEYAYNTTKMRGTDFTPYQVVYGKTPIIHAAPGEPSQAAIDKIRKVAYKNLLYSQVLLQEHENKQRKLATKLRPGDKAYVRKRKARKDRPSASLDDKYWGPFPVKQKVRKSSYELELPPQPQIHPVFNSNVFKRAATHPFPGQRLQNEPPPNIIEGQEEYKVEAIFDKKIKRNGVLYRIKWKEYEETTWEPTNNLGRAGDAVEDFEQRNVGGNQPPNRYGNGRKARRKDEADGRRLHELLWQEVQTGTTEYPSTKG